ncbi:MAG TPA: sigma-70 family RNA polymerase sigma factor [Planctomycetota bacterium]|jgi:RNA polymerase sigma-70 factor (ECF subfamily)|nr:sigma-70 family RNA polymerase sigma factor [Planctomycetota bacterium]
MDPDRELVEACQRAETEKYRKAFEELYNLYKERVYNVAYRITGNPVDALDASQETFGILFRKIRDFRFRSKFSSWVYRIAVNAAIDLKRRGVARRFPAPAPVSGGQDLERLELEADGGRGPERWAGGRELESEVQRAITRLSPKLRAIVVLRHIEGLSYEQISEVLRCSMGTVKSRLARAHESLERSLVGVMERHFVE